MEISSKLSLYDSISILSVGFMIILLFLPYKWVSSLLLLEGVLLFIFSYIIGLIYNKLIETFFSFFRNNLAIIDTAYKKVDSTYGIKQFNILPNLESYYNSYYTLAEHNLLTSIPILEAQSAFLRNIFPIFFLYFFAIGSNLLYNSYIILQIQDCKCFFLVLIFTIIIILPYLWYRIQMKIFELVWEGIYFYKKMHSEYNE